MPFGQLDLLLYAWENKVAIAEVCQVTELSEGQVKRAFRDFNNKAKAARYLDRPPAVA